MSSATIFHQHTVRTVLFLMTVLILCCHGFFFTFDEDDDDTAQNGNSSLPGPDLRFCNSTNIQLSPSECRWPCPNVSTCPAGTEFEFFEPCQLQPWEKALQVGSYNFSSDDGNTTVAPDDYDDYSDDEECRSVCSETVPVSLCCPGFFGQDCLPCPSTDEGQMCGGHGDCNDGLLGDGSCQCHDNFTGILCEQCKDSRKHGPNCTQDCQCVNGHCDNGPTGNGLCWYCDDGYWGSLCEEEILTCDNLTCANHSECYDVYSRPQCVCDSGYEGKPDNVTACTPINPCKEDKYVCGAVRECVYTGPGTYDCRCPVGHEAVAFLCVAINPCLIHNGGCDEQTTACTQTGANASVCDCKAHYENYVEGIGCSLVDVCPTANCHVNANCTTVGPDQYKCTCLPGYVGDGQENCFGNILERLKELNTDHPVLRGQLTYSIGLFDRMYQKPLSEHGPFTFFVPNDRAFRRKSRRDFSYNDMLRNPERTQQIIRQHILVGKLTLEELQRFQHFYTLQGNIADLQVKVAKDVFKYRIRGYGAKAKVIVRDLPAFNGMIHVVNELLINRPNIIGDATKTAMDLIREEGRFNRLQTLISTLGVEHYFQQDNITVFAPENGGLDNLPEGTVEYLTTEEKGKAKLRTLLENHIFRGKIPVTDLVSLQRIHSIANYASGVSFTDMGRIQLNGKVNISQANIPCQNAVYYHIDGPLIPPEMTDLLPSRCNIHKNVTVKGRCTACNLDMECPLDSDTFYGEIKEGCSYWGLRQGSFVNTTGCQPVCVRSYKIPRCCQGFFGLDCQPCPGGFKNPCNGRGECSDERFGTGFCICDKNFRGDKCELCLDRNKFGPNCTQPCTCMHGRCNGGPKGNGQCLPGSCYANFRGDNCQLERKFCRPGRLVCHVHAECVVQSSGARRCECQRGYEGDGQVCEEVDPCQKPQRGNCHQQATCTKIGPGSNRCQCEDGWFGDGFACHPVTPCNSTDHCHSQAQCIDLQPGLSTCKCDEGYEGNGTICTEVDGCLTNNGGCHRLANCTSTGPGTVNCTCPDNYYGDGRRCFTTIAGHIMAHDNLTLLSGLFKKQDPSDVILNEIGEAFTFFAPSDDALQEFLQKVPAGYFDDDTTLMSFFQFHSIGQDYTLGDMLALEGSGSFGRLDTLFDGYDIRLFIKNKTVNVMSSQTTSARVLTGDIAALNGHLHIIDGVLEPFLPDAEQPFLREFLNANTDYSVFGSWLEKKGLIEQLQAMDHYTLFVPDNSIFRPETIQHTITAEYLKYYILPTIVLTPAIDEKQTAETLLGDTHLLQFTINDTQVMVNGVKIIRSNILMMEGVVHTIDGLLKPVINLCNRKAHKTEFGLCGPCSRREDLKCQEGFEPADTTFVQRRRCRYTITDRSGLKHSYYGCRRLCEHTVSIAQCCSGYYGPNCTECPGGPETPCGGEGRGLCDDGMAGTGYCMCERLYKGDNCQLCKDDNMAGPLCNISKQSCQYQNGNCSQNAVCTEAENGDGVHCRCRLGYVGDGFTCTSPCDLHNGGCHANATCSLQDEDQTVNCTCRQGFHGNGVKCEANRDGCEENGGGCSDYADCRYSPPAVTSETEGNVTCDCLPDYVGNGTLCVTTVLNALGQIPATSSFFKKLTGSSEADNVTQLLDSHMSDVTVFVPVGLSGTVNFNDYIVAEEMELSEDLAPDSYNSTDTVILSCSGLPLHISRAQGQFYIQGAMVVEKNIPTTNGYISLLATPYQNQERNENAGSSAGVDMVMIIVPIVVILVLVILVVVGVVCYHRSQASGFLDIVKRFRRGSDASMSFARLKAQESSEDEGQNPFSQPDNVNFDNPLYNDPETL